MSRMRGLVLLGMAALLGSMGTGCVSMKKHNLSELDTFAPPKAGVEKPGATYAFSSRIETIIRANCGEPMLSTLKKEFLEVMNESGCFAPLEKGSGGKDLHIDAHLLNKTHPVAMVSAMISGFSLCVIPGGGTDRCIATVKVKTKAGKEKEYVFEDGVTTIAWVPFILAVPFNRPWAALPETRKNIWRHLIAAMRKDGLVP